MNPPPAPLPNLDRLCLHTITTKPWSLEEAIRGYSAAGIGWITIWRDVLDKTPPRKAGQMIRDAGLRLASLCRGGFFVAEDAAGRARAVDDNRRAIAEAAELGAPLVVLVCGASPAVPLAEARRQIRDGIAAVLPEAEAADVKLAIEPLHPMYAADRSAINTLAQANDLADALNHPSVGVAVDVYHLWWDPALEREIARCGSRLFAFHVCDWRVPTRDLLLDRGLMGEGCIELRRIRGWVEAAGFSGPIEVEIFSNEYWTQDQAEFVERIKQAYRAHV